ncbi:MAG TPA: 2-oxoacid:ferredoxin oxidoreductase subunit gamma [Thermoflexia bacterium]|nr:2-oxoacid:ferredoxin oxidoreductase subunit gamma [Thermoflexia bacterium]
MKHEETIFSGFGGQGALFAGQLLAYTGMAENLYVTWIPSYGPEMRGGTAHCTVIVSAEEIGAPIVQRPSAAVVLNLPSMEKYEPLIKSGGYLVVNESLIDIKSEREDIHVLYLPASDIATELGNPKMANMVLLGAFVTATGLVSLETIAAQLTAHLSGRQQQWLEPNKQALQRGAELVSA